MKTNKINIIAIAFITALVSVSCSKDNDNSTPVAANDFSGNFVQQDQMARPAINTVFNATDASKEMFNGTIPSQMGAKFQASFQSRLKDLNAGYILGGSPEYVNLINANAKDFTTVLATDVLNVSTTKTTTFYDGVNLLTGRTLADDVINVELTLIFGGKNGTDLPQLTNDNVDKNDKDFLTSFPYLAAAW